MAAVSPKWRGSDAETQARSSARLQCVRCYDEGRTCVVNATTEGRDEEFVRVMPERTPRAVDGNRRIVKVFCERASGRCLVQLLTNCVPDLKNEQRSQRRQRSAACAGPKVVARYARERVEHETGSASAPATILPLVIRVRLSSLQPGRWLRIGPRADCRESNSPFALLAPLLRWKIRYLRPLRELLEAASTPRPIPV